MNKTFHGFYKILSAMQLLFLFSIDLNIFANSSRSRIMALLARRIYEP